MDKLVEAYWEKTGAKTKTQAEKTDRRVLSMLSFPGSPLFAILYFVIFSWSMQIFRVADTVFVNMTIKPSDEKSCKVQCSTKAGFPSKPEKCLSNGTSQKIPL